MSVGCRSPGQCFQVLPVSYLELCAQYEQSSLQPPVLMFMRVHICTAEGEWNRL